MLYGPDGKVVRSDKPISRSRMNNCLWCHRRSRLGTKCCNARYREDSKFNSVSRYHPKHQGTNPHGIHLFIGPRRKPHLKRGKFTKHGHKGVAEFVSHAKAR